MVRWEIKKIIKRKSFIILISFLFIYIIYNCQFCINDYNETAASESGEMIKGKEAISINQAAALKYKGKLTTEKIETAHKEYSDKNKFNYGGRMFANTTLDYFEIVFSEQSIKSVQLPDKIDYRDLNFGYSDSWKSLFMNIDSVMQVLPFIFISIFVSVFSYERECGIDQLIATSKHGGHDIVFKKFKACFLILNFIIAFTYLLLFGFMFFRYGLIGYDTSIQCGSWTIFMKSELHFNFFELLVHNFIVNFFVLNVLLLIIFRVSISSDNTFKAAIIVFLFVYFFDITVIHNICDNKIVDLIISFMPINALRSWQVTILPTIELGDIRIYWIYILESIEAIIFVFLLYRLININSKNVYRNS